MRISLIAILVGLVLFLLGSRVLRVVAFPLLFLIFMVPLPLTLFYAVALLLQTSRHATLPWRLRLP
jgi:hypothetical protein